MGFASGINNANRNKAGLTRFPPAHHGFQVYAPQYDGIFSPASDLANDGIGLVNHVQEESREPTVDEYNLMVDEMRLAYQRTFGQKAYEKAVSEKERKMTEERLAKRKEPLLID